MNAEPPTIIDECASAVAAVLANRAASLLEFAAEGLLAAAGHLRHKADEMSECLSYDK